MKKIIFLLTITIFSLSSCSKNDDTPTAVSTDALVLLHSTVKTLNDGSTETTTFIYNGNELSRVNESDGSYETYSYANGLITEVDYYTPLNVVDQRDVYQYNSNNLIKQYQRFDPIMDWGDKEIYTYNSDGTISLAATSGDQLTQTTPAYTGKIFFTNGEVSMIQKYIGSGTEVRSYTYDLKKQAMKNVTGLSKISFIDDEANGVLNNIITEVHTVPSSPTQNYRTDYTYNAAFYPDTSIDFEQNVEMDGTTRYYY